MSILSIYSVVEKRNMFLYIIGIMFYKFGLEAFTGSVALMIKQRYGTRAGVTSWGTISAINLAMQCAGSVLIAPLIARFQVKSVLAVAIWAFAILVSIGIILEAATGGRLPTDVSDKGYHGEIDC